MSQPPLSAAIRQLEEDLKKPYIDPNYPAVIAVDITESEDDVAARNLQLQELEKLREMEKEKEREYEAQRQREREEKQREKEREKVSDTFFRH